MRSNLVLGLIFVLLVGVPTFSSASGGSCLEFEGRWPYGEAEAVAFSGSTVAYSAGSVLRFIQLDDPENPVRLGEVTLPQNVRDIELVPERSIALVSCDGNGLQVIDYSNPATPVIASVLDGYGAAWTAVAKGNVAFVGFSEALVSVDISDPSNLQLLDFPEPTIGAYDAVISGSMLLVTPATGGLAIFDISDPLTPTTLSMSYLEAGWNLAVSGTFLFGTIENNIVVVDFSDPVNPEDAGYVQSSLSPWFEGIAASGPFVFTTADDVGVQIFEWTEVHEFVPVGLWESVASIRGIQVIDDIATVADGHNGLQILNVGEPGSPSVLAAIEGIGSINNVVKKDGFLIGAESGHGLRVVDLESPLPEQTVARLPLPPGAADLALMGNFAVVAGGSGGLHIVDISSPLNPILVASVTVPDKAYRVVVQAPLAFVAAGAGGLRIFDLSDPGSPLEIGHWLDNTNRFTVVSVSGDLAYLLSRDRNGPVVQIDISTPSEPTPVSYHKVAETRYSRTINASGNQLFYCSYLSGLGALLTEFDPGELDAPFGIGALALQFSCYDLAVVGSRILVPQIDSIMTCGFSKDGRIPVFGQEVFPGVAWRMTYSSGKLLPTSSAGGFLVYDARGCLMFAPNVPIPDPAEYAY